MSQLASGLSPCCWRKHPSPFAPPPALIPGGGNEYPTARAGSGVPSRVPMFVEQLTVHRRKVGASDGDMEAACALDGETSSDDHIYI